MLAHPHPLHDATLHNPVIFHADRELNRAGLTTLRFNFRGAGSSDGEHDDGRGEVDDLGAAVGWLRGIAPGPPLLLVGYSFGAWCAIRYALGDPLVAGLIGIGLPLSIYPFDEIEAFGRPLAVVQGDRDELGPLDDVRRRLEDARPRPELRLVTDAEHLFSGKAQEVGRLVASSTRALLASFTLFPGAV